MKINDLKLNLIFFENPISRFYLKFLSNTDVIRNVIVFTNYFIFRKFYTYKNFVNNNSFPILFLKKKKNNYFINFIEEYFNLEKNFIIETYKFNNINSFNFFKKFKDNNYLYTGREIIKKNILQTKNNFFHFHPGYIPEMRGADISLRSVFYKNHIGCTLFKINEKIDSGRILFREKYGVDPKSFQVLKNLDIKDFYKFWYSFVDPSIRLNLLKKLVLNKNDLLKNKEEDFREQNNYFSFLNNNDIKEMYYKLSNL